MPRRRGLGCIAEEWLLKILEALGGNSTLTLREPARLFA